MYCNWSKFLVVYLLAIRYIVPYIVRPKITQPSMLVPTYIDIIINMYIKIILITKKQMKKIHFRSHQARIFPLNSGKLI